MRRVRLTSRMRRAGLVLVAVFAFDDILAQDDTTDPFAAGPKNNWAAQVTAIDASGSGLQNQPPYSNYDADIYEDLDYGDPAAPRSDIESIAGGIDSGFLYFSIALAERWSSASQAVSVVIEFEAGQSGRGDYYIRTNMLAEFDDKGKWKDAGAVGVYVLGADANNDVGGSDPDAVDANPGDGYDLRFGGGSGVVYARVLGNGSFEIAVSRAALQLEAANYFRFRAWAEQSGNDLNGSSFTFHDHLPIMNIGKVDSSAGADTATWAVISDIQEDAVDIAITQTVDAPDSREGDTVVITTTASHISGTQTAQDIQVDFVLPAGLSLVSVDPGSGQWDANRNKWTLATLTPGAQSAFTTTAVIDAGQKGNQIDTVATLKKVLQDDFNDLNNIGGTAIRVVGYDGTIEFTGANGAPLGPVFPGESLFLRVSDPDLDTDSLAAQTIVVSMSSEITRDAVAVILAETAPDSGVFAGSSPTQVSGNAIPGDQLLQVASNDRVIATYVDALDSRFNRNSVRAATVSYAQTAPLLTLVSYADKSRAAPGETLTYRVDYANAGASAALALRVQGQIPDHTTYVTGSLRAGPFGGGYASAVPLSDADDGEDAVIGGVSVAGVFDGLKVTVSVARVEASDGAAGGGPDSGTVYYQVLVQ